jgi:hypothetical protein
MITDQVVNDHNDMHKVTDSMLRDVGLTIDDCGGKVTFAGAEPIRKTVMKAGAAPWVPVYESEGSAHPLLGLRSPVTLPLYSLGQLDGSIHHPRSVSDGDSSKRVL